MYLKFLLLQEDITKHCLLLLLLPLLPGQEVSPVEEVEDSEDAGEENAGEDVDLLGSELEVGEPGGHPVRWNSEDKHDSKIALLHSPNAKTKKKREPSIDGENQNRFFYICGFDPGLEYQRVLALDVDRRATHLLQLETFLKFVTGRTRRQKKKKAWRVKFYRKKCCSRFSKNFLITTAKRKK